MIKYGQWNHLENELRGLEIVSSSSSYFPNHLIFGDGKVLYIAESEYKGTAVSQGWAYTKTGVVVKDIVVKDLHQEITDDMIKNNIQVFIYDVSGEHVATFTARTMVRKDSNDFAVVSLKLNDVFYKILDSRDVM